MHQFLLGVVDILKNICPRVVLFVSVNSSGCCMSIVHHLVFKGVA